MGTRVRRSTVLMFDYDGDQLTAQHCLLQSRRPVSTTDMEILDSARSWCDEAELARSTGLAPTLAGTRIKELRDGGFLVAEDDAHLRQLEDGVGRWRIAPHAFYYHFATREYGDTPLDLRPNFAELAATDPPPAWNKRYDGKPRVFFPEDDALQDPRSFESVIHERTSTRTYLDTPVKLARLGTLLGWTFRWESEVVQEPFGARARKTLSIGWAMPSS